MFATPAYRNAEGKPCKEDISHEMKEQLDAWKHAAIVAGRTSTCATLLRGCELAHVPQRRGQGAMALAALL